MFVTSCEADNEYVLGDVVTVRHASDLGYMQGRTHVHTPASCLVALEDILNTIPRTEWLQGRCSLLATIYKFCSHLIDYLTTYIDRREIHVDLQDFATQLRSIQRIVEMTHPVYIHPATYPCWIHDIPHDDIVLSRTC